MLANRSFTLLVACGLLLMTLVVTRNCVIAAASPGAASVTILCYMNGDNDLGQEVLHALDMMETVGSSDAVNVIALVDSHPQCLAPYEAGWSRTRLVHLQADAQIGRIESPILEEWGEADLGSPQTLERFVRTALAKFPAERIIFYTFAHGQGVIDTRRFAPPPHPAKTLSFSRDDTSGAKLTLDQLHGALEKGLAGRRFDLMVLFSCLANMVEVGYTLSDVTRLLVASQDEIRLVNQPPGRHQIRGMRFEDLIAGLHEDPSTDLIALCRSLVDSHVENYNLDVRLPSQNGNPRVCRYDGGMALVDATMMPYLGQALDDLALTLIRHQFEPAVVAAMHSALKSTQPFASFLNLEYYDLHGFVRHLRADCRALEVIAACNRVLDALQERILIYNRCSAGYEGEGISVYLPHPLVPENIFQTHQSLYGANAFSRDTQWNEMISLYRPHLRDYMRSKGMGLRGAGHQSDPPHTE